MKTRHVMMAMATLLVKGTVADNTALQGNGFGILAYATGTNAWAGTQN